MSTLAVWDPAPFYTPEPYVLNHQERPDDLPRLKESAATMEARVIEWFRGRFGVRGYMAQTPTMCAEARLERCAWIARRRTDDGDSEGWVRFKEDEA